MEPNRTENDFKQKLEQRTIMPSSMAWDRLDAMLSVKEKKKPNKAWMYMAAGFAGILLTVSMFVNYNDMGDSKIDIQESIVNVPAKDYEIPVIKQPVTPHPEIIKKEAIAVIKQEVNKRQINKKVIATISEKVAVTQQNTIEPEIKQTSAVPTAGEKLLAGIEQMPVKQRKSLVKVDPGSLLSSVESELDEGFRTRALQTISKNYSVIVSSLANRNHQ